MHVINHEWNISMFVASAVYFVWDTKPDLPTWDAWVMREKEHKPSDLKQGQKSRGLKV